MVASRGRANAKKVESRASTTRAARVPAKTPARVPAKSRPRVSAKEFVRRRRDLMALMEPGSIAILPAAQPRRRNGDTDFPFRQDSDFYYLTGFEEWDAVFVLVPGREHGDTILFCREREEVFERWNGPLLGPDAALETLQFADAFPITDIDEILPGLIEGREKLYYAMGVNRDFDNRIIEWVNSISRMRDAGAEKPGEFVQLDQYLHELRLIKSREELALMRRAADVTRMAHERAMQVVRPGMFEYQLQAELEYVFRREGARASAYPPIVGGGNNGCVLHYIANTAPLRDGDLVLIDAGCEYEYYASDITRTFPVNGKFSKEQRALYEVVLHAQKAAIDKVRPGNHWEEPHAAAVAAMSDGLVRLGLLEGPVEDVIESERYKTFCMHKTGHWLGMDVHDVGEYRVGGESRVFEAGMVLTVEPGIYVPRGHREAANKWHGIGIRIEDNVLVTPKGHEVITGGLVREVDEIEALVGSARAS